MTEPEYVIAHFEERFRAFRGKRIVLHGSRNYAQEIIRHFNDDFRFAGVMSRDAIEGTEFCGLPVLQESALAALQIDMIILTERVKYAEAVYSSIFDVCDQNGILLYNMYGINEIETHRYLEKCLPLKLEEWQELCGQYQLVAFEAMDTLLLEPDLVMRDEMRSLITWLISQGIDVRISLRKSMPADKQIKALGAAGLFDDLEAHLIVRQGEDLSFRKLRENNPEKKILYIGSGLVNECLLPRCYGIDTYQFTDIVVGMPTVPAYIPHIPYDSGAKDRILQAIHRSKVVSFDVFDTLLVRKTLRPDDVFGLTEQRAGALGYPAESFADIRRKAEHVDPYSTIHEIYARLRRYYGWSAEQTADMMRLELDVENDVIIPRTEVVELLNEAVSAGKTVVLVSDMYLTEPVLRELLEKKGIRSYDKLYVSCDYRRAKKTGLFEELFRLAPQPEDILHLGDNAEADIQPAEALGIRTEQIFSPVTLAASRGWLPSIDSAETLMERCLVGMTIAALFRDPFQNPNLLELTMEERLQRFANGVVGPFAAAYTSWLLLKLQERHYDGVLFLSRDGYLLLHIYRELMSRLKLPDPVYFYANRHSGFLCCADDPSTITSAVNRAALYNMSVDDLLINMYGLPKETLLPHIKGESASEYILRHMPWIQERAEAFRNAYTVYSAHCGLQPGSTYAVVDFIALGSTQKYIQSFLPFQMDGFYFGNYMPGEREKQHIEHIEDYMVIESSSLVQNFIELEGYFTSPEPPLDHIAEDGSAVFEQEPRTEEERNEYAQVFSASLDYAKEFFRLFYIEGEQIRPKLPENMFAAEGYHGVLRSIHDDWPKKKLPPKKWYGGL